MSSTASISDGMPDELARQIPHDVRLYVRNFWRHPEDPNRPYDFYDGTGEKYFYYLTDDNGPLNPEEWGDIVVLLFARGCLKTTTCTMIANWAADCYPVSEGLVTAPRRDQTQEVMGRIDEAVEMSGLDEQYDRDKRTHKRFEHQYVDENGAERVAYSEIKSRSAWGEGDALRGIHAHYGVVDEFQDVDEGMFSVFLETVDREVPGVDYFPTIFVIGTPKMAGSFFQRLWEMSDMREWNDDDKTWEQTSDGAEYMPQEMRERRAELEKRIETLEDDEDDHTDDIESFREELDDIEGFTVTGWHIDQHACPRHSEQEIAFKRAEYPKKKFENEVEARFYSPENDLLTAEMVKQRIDPENGFTERPTYESADTFIGVDWGGGDGESAASTVITVLQEDQDETFSVRTFDVLSSDLSPSEEVKRVEDYIIQFQPEAVVVDEGHGDAKRSNLQDGVGTRDPDGYGDIVYGCVYGHVNKKDGVTWSRKGNRDYFTVHRTFMVESMVGDFRRGKITIPGDGLSYDSRNALGSMIVDQLSAPYTERVETPDGKKKKRIKADRDDDIFHSLVYAWIAANHVASQRQLFEVAAHDMY